MREPKERERARSLERTIPLERATREESTMISERDKPNESTTNTERALVIELRSNASGWPIDFKTGKRRGLGNLLDRAADAIEQHIAGLDEQQQEQAGRIKLGNADSAGKGYRTVEIVDLEQDK